MRDYELAAIAFIAWVLLYDFSEDSSRAQVFNRVKIIDTGSVFSLKVDKSLTWKKIDFMDDWNHYRIYSEGNMQRHEFRIIHEYDQRNRIEFKLYGDYFLVTDDKSHRFKVKLDASKDKVEIQGMDHDKTKWLFEVT